MNETPATAKWQPSATVVALVLCCAWIAATTCARWFTSLDDNAPRSPFSGPSAVGIVVCLCAATVFVSGVFSTGMGLRTTTGHMVAAVLFAAAASAHLVADSVAFRDAAAVLLTLAGVQLALQKSRYWIGVTLLGIACSLSPLVAGALVVLVCPESRESPGRTPAARLGALLICGAIAVTAILIALVTGHPWTEAVRASNDVARVGPAFLWTLAAEWADLGMPAVVLALLAVSDRLFGPPRQTPAAQTPAPGCYPMMIWLLINAVAGVCVPRVMVTHGLPFILPAFLLVPAGWCLLRQLPFDRSQWTLSLFSTICYLLPLLLLWVPIRKAAELIMAALLVP